MEINNFEELVEYMKNKNYDSSALGLIERLKNIGHVTKFEVIYDREEPVVLTYDNGDKVIIHKNGVWDHFLKTPYYNFSFS